MKTKLISSLVILLMTNNYLYAYDLAYAYNKALEYNAEYLKAIANNLAGKESKIIARSSLLPQISATTSASEDYLSQSGGYQFSIGPSVGASLNQVLFDFSQFSKYTKAKYETEIANLELSNAKEKLLVTISKAYFDVLYAKDTLLAVQKNKEALLEQQKQAKRSFELGVNTIADVNEAQAGYDKAAADEITATNDLINRKTIFYNLTGLNPEQIQPLKEKIDLSTINPSTPKAWSAIAESGNWNIKIANKQLQMAKEDIAIARGGHIPTLNLAGNYSYDQTITQVETFSSAVESSAINIPGNPISPATTTANLSINLIVPIYSGGQVSAQVRQATAKYRASQQQLINIKRQTDQQTQNAYWSIENGIKVVNARNAALKSAQSKLDSDKLAYKLGQRNSFELVDAQRNYSKTSQEYKLAQYNFLNAHIELCALSGSALSTKECLDQINLNIKQ